MDCFKCGALSAGVIEVISNKPKEGIILVCKKCAELEGLVELKRPNLNKLKEIEAIDKDVSFKKGVESFNPTPIKNSKEDASLREIVEKNYKEKISFNDRPKDLIRNFHWIIMRERQRKKMTHAQMASAIGESETAIKMAEKGILPSDGQKLINKIEAFLGIFLSEENKFENPFEYMKEKTISNIKENPDEVDLTDKVTSKFVTIGDLKKVKEDSGLDFSIEEDGSFNEKKFNKPELRTSEELRKEDFVKRALENKDKGFGDDSSKKSFKDLHEQRIGKINGDGEFKEEKELAQDEINKLIFGKR